MKNTLVCGLLLGMSLVAGCDPASVEHKKTQGLLNSIEPDLSIELEYKGRVGDSTAPPAPGVWHDYQVTFRNNSSHEAFLTTAPIILDRYELLAEGNERCFGYKVEAYRGSKRQSWFSESTLPGGGRLSIAPGTEVNFRAKIASEIRGEPVQGSRIRITMYAYANIQQDRNGLEIASNPLPFPPNK